MLVALIDRLLLLKSRPDNSATDNSADLKIRQFNQKYADNSAKDNSANNIDCRSRANVLRACQQRVGLYTKFRASYRREARIARPPATLNQEITPVPIFFLRIWRLVKLAELSQAELAVYFWLNCLNFKLAEMLVVLIDRLLIFKCITISFKWRVRDSFPYNPIQ